MSESNRPLEWWEHTQIDVAEAYLDNVPDSVVDKKQVRLELAALRAHPAKWRAFRTEQRKRLKELQ